MHRYVLAIVAAASVGLVGRVEAAPMLAYQISDGANLLASGTTVNGVATSVSTNDSHFSISLNAVGAPAVVAPNFSNNSFSISSDGSAGTLTIKVTDTGLTSPATNVLDAFTTNSLAGGGFTGDTITNYYDDTDTAFGTEFTLGSASYSGSGSYSTGPVSATLTPTGLYSETTVYTLTFGSGSQGASVSASSQIVAAVPEPASLTLIGVGVAAIGMRRRRRNPSA